MLVQVDGVGRLSWDLIWFDRCDRNGRWITTIVNGLFLGGVCSKKSDKSKFALQITGSEDSKRDLKYSELRCRNDSE